MMDVFFYYNSTTQCLEPVCPEVRNQAFKIFEDQELISLNDLYTQIKANGDNPVVQGFLVEKAVGKLLQDSKVMQEVLKTIFKAIHQTLPIDFLTLPNVQSFTNSSITLKTSSFNLFLPRIFNTKAIDGLIQLQDLKIPPPKTTIKKKKDKTKTNKKKKETKTNKKKKDNKTETPQSTYLSLLLPYQVTLASLVTKKARAN